MATDWAADVKKYAPKADDKVIAGIVKHCGIALHKKLALTDSDEALDAAIEAVGEKMKGVNRKNRVTVYYLLADHFGKLSLFG